MPIAISASVGRGGVNRANDVRTIQQALNDVGPENGGPSKLLAVDGICGPLTIDAIQKFQLKHFGWKGADGRVDPNGPTIAKINEILDGGGGNGDKKNYTCCLSLACPPDSALHPPIAGEPAALQRVNFVPMTLTPSAPRAPLTDAQIMANARADSRKTLKLARDAMTNLLQGFANESTTELNDFQKRVLISCQRWIKIDGNRNNAARASATTAIRQAITLMDRNIAVANSSGSAPAFRRTVGLGAHAQTTGNPDDGIECGDPFFNVDGPRCRRDVLTHEFFHFVGVHHGGGGPQAATPRASITTTAQALDSADNLAQLVSELMDGTRDACAVAGR